MIGHCCVYNTLIHLACLTVSTYVHFLISDIKCQAESARPSIVIQLDKAMGTKSDKKSLNVTKPVKTGRAPPWPIKEFTALPRPSCILGERQGPPGRHTPPRGTKRNSPPMNGHCTNHKSHSVTVSLASLRGLILRSFSSLRCGFTVFVKGLRTAFRDVIRRSGSCRSVGDEAV